MASRSKKKKSKNKSTIISKPTAPLGSMNYVQQQFGLPTNGLETVDTIEDLRKTIPNIVIAKCKYDSFFKQNNFKIQKLNHGEEYVMSISIFKSLEYDKYNIVNGQPRLNLVPAKKLFKNIYKPYQGENLTNKKLLVMRTGGIGDLLFILPNLIHLKKLYPTCKIVFATSPQYHSMVERWIIDGYIDKVIALPFITKELLSAQYHLCFEGVIERTKESEKTNAYQLFSKWMDLNLPDSQLHPIQSVSEDLVRKVSKILSTELGIGTNDKLCAIQLKASSPIRTPHPDKFWLPIIRQIISMGYKVLITDNPQMHEQIESLLTKYYPDKLRENIFNFTKYSEDISHTIALASIVDVVVGTDSSLIHIAESVGTKNFGIYGPFPGNVRVNNYQYGTWLDCKYDCAPCFTHGHKPCIHGGNNGGCSPCYESIDMTEFKNKFKELVGL